MDYSEYDLLDEFTVRQIFIACSLKEDGSFDGTKSGIVRDALIRAIKVDELISTVHTDKHLREKYLSNDMPQSAIEWNLSAVRIQRDELKKWFKSKGQQPAFLFKEARTSDGQKQNKPLSGKEQENLLKTIGLLSRVLAETKGALFGSCDNPNKSKIVELLLTHIQNNELSDTGLGKSTLSEKISAGLKLLQ